MVWVVDVWYCIYGRYVCCFVFDVERYMVVIVVWCILDFIVLIVIVFFVYMFRIC